MKADSIVILEIKVWKKMGFKLRIFEVRSDHTVNGPAFTNLLLGPQYFFTVINSPLNCRYFFGLLDITLDLPHGHDLLGYQLPMRLKVFEAILTAKLCQDSNPC